jgi:hypothetical protein
MNPWIQTSQYLALGIVLVREAVQHSMTLVVVLGCTRGRITCEPVPAALGLT